MLIAAPCVCVKMRNIGTELSVLISLSVTCAFLSSHFCPHKRVFLENRLHKRVFLFCRILKSVGPTVYGSGTARIQALECEARVPRLTGHSRSISREGDPDHSVFTTSPQASSVLLLSIGINSISGKRTARLVTLIMKHHFRGHGPSQMW